MFVLQPVLVEGHRVEVVFSSSFLGDEIIASFSIENLKLFIFKDWTKKEKFLILPSFEILKLNQMISFQSLLLQPNSLLLPHLI